MPQIINVSNRLPVTIGKTIKASSGGLVSALAGIRQHHKLKWIGWPGTDAENSAKAQSIRQTLKQQYGYVPVFLNRKEVKNYYHGFANSSLWPLLHYMPNYYHHNTVWWDDYYKVNEKFADEIARNCRKNDTVWIHDYHFMLLPKMLRQRKPNIKIAFFLHTPFPSYEVFRCLPHRKELVEGLLGCDLIGFHTFGYLRHFRSSAVRLLGLESTIDSIKYASRQCKLGVYPIGADAQSFVKEMELPGFKKKKDQLSKMYGERKIVLSVERLDYTKGIPNKLEAIDRFLAKYKSRNDVVFIFISVPSRGEVAEYQQLLENIETKVGRINGKYATVTNIPVHFINKSIKFTELVALYSLADVALVTPLADGMNLVAKEYAACKQDGQGVLILSEFAGAVDEFYSALNVNPYDIEDIIKRLEQAFEMPKEEQTSRMEKMHKRVIDYDAVKWANSFLADLEALPQQSAPKIKKVTASTYIKNKIKTSKKIACFLDYDGTLRELQKNADTASPTSPIKKLLNSLARKKNIDTYIISGRKQADLESWLGNYPFTLIAEHGFSYRKAANKNWQHFRKNVDLSWKEKVKELCQQYVKTTPGSFVEEKASAIVWHYRRSDPEFGQWKATQLLSTLHEFMTNQPVEVHQGKKIVETSSIQINKGAALKSFAKMSDYDLIICAGDDQTDESMFRADDDRIVSVKVGQGETLADFTVKSPEAFRKLMQTAIR